MLAKPQDPALVELTVIVVSYNTRDLTLACLASLFEETRCAFEVLVVDNASDDGSASAVAAGFPHVQLIAHEENLGFARANNEAAREAQGDRILLLNPDTVVLDGAIDRLLDFARSRPERRMWGGRTVFADGTPNPTSCWGAPTLWSTFCLASGLAALFPRSRVLNPERRDIRVDQADPEVELISGCFLMIDTALWQELGGFDPRFFMYGEDADLCLRARAAGARPTVAVDATIVHYGGASERVLADKVVRLFVAKVQLFDRHWPPLAARAGSLLIDLWAFTRATGYAVLCRVRGAHRSTAAQWRVVFRRRREWRRTEGLRSTTD